MLINVRIAKESSELSFIDLVFQATCHCFTMPSSMIPKDLPVSPGNTNEKYSVHDNNLDQGAFEEIAQHAGIGERFHSMQSQLRGRNRQLLVHEVGAHNA